MGGPATGLLAGKVAVVTGASSGIGRAIVSALVKAGAHVAMGARRVDALEKTRELVMEECPGTSSKAVIVKTDVTKLSDVQDLVGKAEQFLGPVDIMVNVAGVMYFTLMQNTKWDQWEQTVDVNCKGTTSTHTQTEREREQKNRPHGAARGTSARDWRT